MKLNKAVIVFVYFLSIQVSAQDYLFPVKPGQRNFLSGNFAEIRPNHFHSGIDVKIGGVDGEPIRVIADGYVYRAKVSSYGYGNVLYIKHYNGQSSVYAHLQKFSPTISERMRQEMYQAQKNELEVYFDEDALPVKRGDIIANGGNTGSSGGPHLHFEIRDSLDRAIDPFQFNFRKEIVDNTPPILYKVALRPLDYESRVNGKFERQEFTPILEGGNYVIPQTVKISGNVGVEIYGVDKQDGVNNIFGIPVYELLEDEKPLYRINVDNIDFNKGRFLLSHTYLNRFTRLYDYPNNQIKLYEADSISKGKITAMIGTKKKLQVNLKDYFGNTRVLNFEVEGEAPAYQQGGAFSKDQKTKVYYQREVMVIETKQSNEGNLAKIYTDARVMEIPPAYEENGKRIYLWDMDFGVPDSIDVCTEVIVPEVLTKIPFGQELSFSNKDVRIDFEENTLLDDLFLRMTRKNTSGNVAITINPSGDYLQNNMTVHVNNTDYKGDKSKSHIYSLANNGRKSFVGGEWEGEDIRFKTRNFGTFVIDSDFVSPNIYPIQVNANEIKFKISDDKSGIRDFEAFVDGKWILMRYEHKQATIWSEKSDKQPFKGEVLLKVRDMAGNEAVWSGTIK
ncbi:M23 family metallopeptidase [Belliella sp. DSM 107340]|uniref:M23 family metallopeptidase n=1 Tax=Belliella calami TaxID=2923436 RepID=A0ABS9UN51_9BACT|nr:M23 family metallopeptidase [Belliella calami]MCH7398054.1 M23 family metallopeptidase [Belliella calami]